MAKRYEELTFSDDFMFCKVMQDEQICKGVLELLLDIKIAEIHYIQKQRTIDESYIGHGVRFDVYVEGDDKIFDVEIQTTIKKDFGLRTRYYQSMMDMENLEKGQNYDELKQSIIIFICLNDPFDLGLPVYRFKTVCLDAETVNINDKIEKYFYNASSYMRCKNTQVREFLEYLKKGTKTSSGLFRRISETVERVRKNEQWRHEYMIWNLAYTDAIKEGRAAGLAEGREEGRAAGFAEGREEGRVAGLAEGHAEGLAEGAEKRAYEDALSALRFNLAPEMISQMFNLPLEKVMELKNQLEKAVE